MSSVKLGEWWPSQCWTCTMFRPSAKRREATVCRNVWKPAHATPASLTRWRQHTGGEVGHERIRDAMTMYGSRAGVLRRADSPDPWLSRPATTKSDSGRVGSSCDSGRRHLSLRRRSELSAVLRRARAEQRPRHPRGTAPRMCQQDQACSLRLDRGGVPSLLLPGRHRVHRADAADRRR